MNTTITSIELVSQFTRTSLSTITTLISLTLTKIFSIGIILFSIKNTKPIEMFRITWTQSSPTKLGWSKFTTSPAITTVKSTTEFITITCFMMRMKWCQKSWSSSFQCFQNTLICCASFSITTKKFKEPITNMR